MPDFVLASAYEPFEKQQEFHRSTKRFKVASSGNRGGKTMSGAAEFVANVFRDLASGKGKPAVRIGATRIPRLTYWVVTPTSALAEFPYRELIRFLPRGLIDKVNASTRELWLKGDIQIGFRSTERPELLVAETLNGLWMDEGPRCKAEAWRGGLRARLADQEGWALFTGSPLGGRGNWLYQDLVSKEGVDEHVAAFSWTTEDNLHIPRGEIEHARRTLPDSWFKRDWLASWDAFGGSIYEEFRDESHVISEAAFRLEYGLGSAPFTSSMMQQLFRRVVCGVDFGFTSPGSMNVIGHLGDTRMIALEESYAAGRSILGSGVTWLSEAQRLRDKWGVSLFVCDPARPDGIQDLSTNGIPAVGAYNDVYLGIRRVAEGFHVVDGRPGLRMLDQCAHLRGEVRSYQWKSTRDQSGFLEVPADKQSDHGCDATRYAVVELRPYVTTKSEEGRTRRQASSYR